MLHTVNQPINRQQFVAVTRAMLMTVIQAHCTKINTAQRRRMNRLHGGWLTCCSRMKLKLSASSLADAVAINRYMILKFVSVTRPVFPAINCVLGIQVLWMMALRKILHVHIRSKGDLFSSKWSALKHLCPSVKSSSSPPKVSLHLKLLLHQLCVCVNWSLLKSIIISLTWLSVTRPLCSVKLLCSLNALSLPLYWARWVDS